MHLDAMMHQWYTVSMRTTVNLNEKLLKSLKQRALDTDATVSTLIEQAVANQLLEDYEDIESAAAREHEPTHSFESLVTEFKAEGLI